MGIVKTKKARELQLPGEASNLNFDPVISKGLSKIHKQPRSFLHTAAKYVGKSGGQGSLFDIGEFKEVSPEKFDISRKTAILANFIFQLWQGDGGDSLKVNLGSLSKMMQANNYETKILLLNLGGYAYPFIDRTEDGGLAASFQQLFSVTFSYGPNVGAKYPTHDDIPKIGTGMLNFLKDEPITSITIKPNPAFSDAIKKGDGLGNVFVQDDEFVSLAIGLKSDIAYKILSFTAANHNKVKRAEGNLIKALGLEKQVKDQSKQRVRNFLKEAFNELKEKGHLQDWKFEPESLMYSWTCSKKYVNHKEQKGPK